MKLRATLSALALGISLCGPVLASDRLIISAQQIQALGVSLLTVTPSTTSLSIAYPARVILTPDQERVVSSAFAAMISRVLVQEGETVRAGQTLLELQSPDFAGLQLDFIQAAGKARLAAAALGREQELFAEGITPRRRLLEAEAANQESRAGLFQARAALELAGMAKAAISRLEKGGSAGTTLQLTAPAAGVVTALAIRPGQRVAAADPLLHLVRNDKAWVEIQLPLAVASRYQPGMSLSVGTPPVAARLISISPVAGNAQSVSVRARVTTAAPQLLPGAAIEARLPSTGGAWLLPQAAITRRGQQAYIFVRTAQGFEARPVAVRATSGQQVQVEGQLVAGEKVAVSRIIALKGAWLDQSGTEAQ